MSILFSKKVGGDPKGSKGDKNGIIALDPYWRTLWPAIVTREAVLA